MRLHTLTYRRGYKVASANTAAGRCRVTEELMRLKRVEAL
jgi:hypothetical protein